MLLTGMLALVMNIQSGHSDVVNPGGIEPVPPTPPTVPPPPPPNPPPPIVKKLPATATLKREDTATKPNPADFSFHVDDQSPGLRKGYENLRSVFSNQLENDGWLYSTLPEKENEAIFKSDGFPENRNLFFALQYKKPGVYLAGDPNYSDYYDKDGKSDIDTHDWAFVWEVPKKLSEFAVSIPMRRIDVADVDVTIGHEAHVKRKGRYHVWVITPSGKQRHIIWGNETETGVDVPAGYEYIVRVISDKTGDLDYYYPLQANVRIEDFRLDFRSPLVKPTELQFIDWYHQFQSKQHQEPSGTTPVPSSGNKVCSSSLTCAKDPSGHKILWRLLFMNHNSLEGRKLCIDARGYLDPRDDLLACWCKCGDDGHVIPAPTGTP